MVFDYSKYHHLHDSLNAAAIDNVRKWDAEFVKHLVDDVPTLLQLTMAANCLHIYNLLDLTAEVIAGIFIGKTLKEIRKTLNIVNAFSPE